MRFSSVEFKISAVRTADLPKDGLPEIALVGRSNVGKSSLINRLVQRKRLARTSTVPGKTQQLNYYLANEQFYLVDLPGYGYVRGGVGLRLQLGPAHPQLHDRPRGIVRGVGSSSMPGAAPPIWTGR